jgi:hypothetical protein
VLLIGSPTTTGAQPPASAKPPLRVVAGPADAPPPVVDMTPVELPGRPVTIVETEPGHQESPPAFLVSAEYLLIRPSRRPNDFAIIDPANDLTPIGRVRAVNFDTSSGIRASIGYRAAGSAWESLFTYTYVHADGDRQAFAPDGGLIYPTLTRPGLVDNALAGAAGLSLNYHLYDLEAARRACLADAFAFRLGFGVRVAMIDHDLAAFYDGGDAAGALVRNRIDFDGAGPMVGGEGQWLLGRGFRLFGRARGALVVGDHTSRLEETNFGGLVVNAAVRERVVQTVPVLEMATGLAWEYRHVRLSVGYEVANWFGLIDSPSFVDDFAEGKLGRRRGDLGLEAIFFQLGLAY